MWQAEVLYRQGWWVKRFEDEDSARAFINERIKADKKSTNPVKKDHRGRHRVVLANMMGVYDTMPPARAPEHSFDDEENGWKP